MCWYRPVPPVSTGTASPRSVLEAVSPGVFPGLQCSYVSVSQSVMRQSVSQRSTGPSMHSGLRSAHSAAQKEVPPPACMLTRSTLEARRTKPTRTRLPVQCLRAAAPWAWPARPGLVDPGGPCEERHALRWSGWCGAGPSQGLRPWGMRAHHAKIADPGRGGCVEGV